MNRRFAGGVVLAAALALGAESASAQSWTKESSPLAIHAIAAPEGEQVARKDEPLLVQPMTSIRNVRLLAAAPTMMAMSQNREYPAGTELYGIQAPDGWIYCAAARTWLLDPTTICYQDMDNDGAFDRVRDSGMPFGNVPLLAYAFGPHKLLNQPVRYEELPFGQGPSASYVVRWAPVRDRAPYGEPERPIRAIGWGASIKVGERMLSLGEGPNVDLFTIQGPRETLPPIMVMGAVIEPLGLTPEGALRYRVRRAIPAQVLQIRMTMTVHTYYYVY
ncbi:MAG: hypothetical protein K1X35_10615 [Caulobacteraceae bacterium]|nr:hypothetical protein [Caulobacteraceae bacterium]